MANSRNFLKRRLGVRASEENVSSESQRDEISQIAYALYEQRGRDDGHDVQDWLKAEEAVRNQKQFGTAARE